MALRAVDLYSALYRKYPWTKQSASSVVGSDLSVPCRGDVPWGHKLAGSIAIALI